ncbi:MAG: acetylxylan esterase [Armatimonadota bacterium]|nr:acetylxylan esterase [bacterium]
MPLIDMPLEELKSYQGRNPRPKDLDEYWDTALAEMKSIDPQVELVPCKTESRNVEYFDLYFTGVGGARIHAKYLRPKNISGKCPAVVNFHGYTGNAGDWFGYRAWAAEGFCTAGLDCRGQGGYSEDTGGVTGNTHNGHIIRGLADSPDKLLFRSIYLDCAQLAGIVMNMPEVDAERVGATGGSQGGGLTVACAALEPRIKRAAPVFPFLTDYLRVWEMDLAEGAYAELKTFFKFFDPRHECEDEIFNKLGYIDLQHLAKRIKGDILMLTGLMDNICPPSTQFAIYNKITSKKNVVIYPDFGHEGLPDSGDIIFNFMCGL